MMKLIKVCPRSSSMRMGMKRSMTRVRMIMLHLILMVVGVETTMKVRASLKVRYTLKE